MDLKPECPPCGVDVKQEMDPDPQGLDPSMVPPFRRVHLEGRIKLEPEEKDPGIQPDSALPVPPKTVVQVLRKPPTGPEPGKILATRILTKRTPSHTLRVPEGAKMLRFTLQGGASVTLDHPLSMREWKELTEGPSVTIRPPEDSEETATRPTGHQQKTGSNQLVISDNLVMGPPLQGASAQETALAAQLTAQAAKISGTRRRSWYPPPEEVGGPSSTDTFIFRPPIDLVAEQAARPSTRSCLIKVEGRPPQDSPKGHLKKAP
ncbi:MAG: hypothetical protein AN484_26175 [Aphanizomenon flos-aquae WA102]|uniref:Uncharacterized protein n=1 Tax=Aphanizomenon flos-aquae WA102 TaxID=1710896 RepID=A0A1B7WEJ6_APHFL|nr:MAG: hypothetical protein AN484_26175 [Aphanizomenon flos-aquae WA102]